MARVLFVPLLLLIAGCMPRVGHAQTGATPIDDAWRAAGWSAEEAAAHALSRFTYGARPQDVAHAASVGLDAWLLEQVGADDRELDRHINQLDAVQASFEELAQREPGDAEQAMYRDLLTQRVGRAVHAESQLREVMAGFWFDHFNVSVTDRLVRPYVIDYDLRIREHALGDFRTLLGVVARHPAMLLYLDNARSLSAPEFLPARADERIGVNENYARELLELHTLGVDGGYDEQDVRELARVFTGWSIDPVMPDARQTRRDLRSLPGNEQDGAFVFYAALHDDGPKVVLGVSFPGGEGSAEGERMLDVLATHESTARFVARKFATRFVADDPTDAIVDAIAEGFSASDEAPEAMVRAALSHPDFWSESTRAQKVKTPFELLVSLLRLLEVEHTGVETIDGLLRQLGQPMFAYTPPTGFPAEGTYWTSGSALVMRANIGYGVAAGRIPGFDAPAHVVPSMDADRLRQFADRMLPAHTPAERQALVDALLETSTPVGLERRAGDARGEELPEMLGRARAIEWFGGLLASPEFQLR